MFHKRKVDLSTLREPDQKRFRHNVSNLFLTKTVSARRANELMKDAQIAGAAGVKDLVKGAEKSGSGEKQANWEKNLARDMKRKMLKNCLWFNEYIALIPCYNPETQAEEMKKIPFLLPHEIHFVFSKRSQKKDLLQTGGMCELSKKHSANMQMQFQVREAIGLGLWIDGTPYNYDRSQTLECISLNFPGLLPPNGTLRILLCCIPKHWCIKGVTLSKMLGILSWSFIHLANCTWPSARHDGSFWHPGDKKRSTFNGKALPFTAFLLEVRGDWAMTKEVFQFPGWRDKQGSCHLCLCKPIEIRNFESCKAFDPLDHFTLLQSISNSGIDINELFQTPGLTSKQFLLDWLHIVDLGVAADFMGNVFHHLIASGNHLPGNNVKERVKSLFHRIQLQDWRCGKQASYFDSPHDQKESQFKSKTSSQSCRSSRVDYFCKTNLRWIFGWWQCVWIYNQDGCHRTVAMLFLSKNLWNHQSMLLPGRKFLLLCKSLENETDHTWKIKPKHHSFLDLLLQNSCPSDSWTYRDEDFGGFLAHLGAVKGGSHNPYSIGMSVLQSFRAQVIPELKWKVLLPGSGIRRFQVSCWRRCKISLQLKI